MMSNVDEKYLFAVSDDEDDAAPGAVSSLSSEDEARSPVDWRAVVGRGLAMARWHPEPLRVERRRVRGRMCC